jgi:hypothetical protein
VGQVQFIGRARKILVPGRRFEGAQLLKGGQTHVACE